MTPEQIIARAAVAFGIESGSLVAGGRAPLLVQARQAAAYVMRQQYEQSFTTIGRALGYADHSTAISAVLAAETRARARPDYAAKIAQISEAPHES